MVVEEDWVLNMEDGWSRAASAYMPLAGIDPKAVAKLRECQAAVYDWMVANTFVPTGVTVTDKEKLRATEEWACRIINAQTAEIDALREMVAELSKRPTVDQWKALMASAANPFGAEPELAPAPAWLRLPVRNPLTGR